MKALLAFIMAFIAFYLGTTGILNKIKSPQSAVLSARVTADPVLASNTNTPAPSPTTFLLPSPTSKPTSTPTPRATITPKKTATPKSSPILSPTASPIATPTPGPATPTPFIWIPTEMSSFFAQYAGQYHVDGNIIARIANCESHFNPNASNGIYLGMFQYDASRWKSERSQMGLDTNPALRSNIEESIKTAAFTLSKDGTSPWPNCLR